MRTKFILLGLLIILIIFFITKTLSQETSGPHGGIVKQSGNYNIEMKNLYGDFYAFLLDKKLKPISNKEVSCEVKFYFPDNTITNMKLVPFGEDGFTSEPVPEYFSTCMIIFKISGNTVSAEFENEMLFVKK